MKITPFKKDTLVKVEEHQMLVSRTMDTDSEDPCIIFQLTVLAGETGNTSEDMEVSAQISIGFKSYEERDQEFDDLDSGISHHKALGVFNVLKIEIENRLK